ncbi:MAG TPA: type II toxin-antitoxin system PemK/MazF family toxin [Gemmataceae bacterium]|nr:type II toxin-antitoxin system PemK/MazF family toxin [Gemmataceae bacterium]
MIQQGEIYLYSDPRIPPHPVVVVSREELNCGDRVVAAVITSAKFAVRSKLANRVALKAGHFGMTKDCVIQEESLFNAPTLHMDPATGPIGKLDDVTLREVVRAVGYVMDSDCVPN